MSPLHQVRLVLIEEGLELGGFLLGNLSTARHPGAPRLRSPRTLPTSAGTSAAPSPSPAAGSTASAGVSVVSPRRSPRSLAPRLPHYRPPPRPLPRPFRAYPLSLIRKNSWLRGGIPDTRENHPLRRPLLSPLDTLHEPSGPAVVAVVTRGAAHTRRARDRLSTRARPASATAPRPPVLRLEADAPRVIQFFGLLRVARSLLGRTGHRKNRNRRSGRVR